MTITRVVSTATPHPRRVHLLTSKTGRTLCGMAWQMKEYPSGGLQQCVACTTVVNAITNEIVWVA